MSDIMQIDDEKSDKHPVRRIAGEVETAVCEHWREIDLITPLESRGAAVRDGAAVNPVISAAANDQIQKGTLPFSLEDMLDNAQNTGEKFGSSNVTAIHVTRGNAIADTVKVLAMTGQLDDAMEIFETVRDESDPSAAWLVAYAIFTYAKGWVAEVVISNDDRFSKLWVTNDQAGQDVRLGDDRYLQIKAMTHYASNGPKKFRLKDVEHWFYQWTTTGLVVGPLEDANKVNAIAAKDGEIGKTLIKTTSDRYKHPEDGFEYRFLWW